LNERKYVSRKRGTKEMINSEISPQVNLIKRKEEKRVKKKEETMKGWEWVGRGTSSKQ